MYRVHILDEATRQLAQLDKPIGRFVVRRINWLAENLDDIRPEALAGDLSGLYKLRAGDYRILYESIIVIHEIGHRRGIYRKRS